MCGDCANACPTHAIDIDKDGNVTVQNPYCVNCGACVTVCPDDALTMETFDASELVIPDKDAEEIARQKAKAKAEAQKYLETGKKQLNKVGDALERMEDASRNLYATQFHPEVRHTASGTKMLENFLFKICGLEKTWTMSDFDLICHIAYDQDRKSVV